jgi:hypothetical protein
VVNIIIESMDIAVRMIEMDIDVRMASPMLRRLANQVGWRTIRAIPTSIRTGCSAMR